MPYGITQCYLPPGRGENFAFIPRQAKQVLDLATPEGCKAESVDLFRVTDPPLPLNILSGST